MKTSWGTKGESRGRRDEEATRSWSRGSESSLVSPAIPQLLPSRLLPETAISSLFRSRHTPDSLPMPLQARQLLWDPQAPLPGSWEHHTFRGSGRSAESCSAYSWIGGWKKRLLVCHRRLSCFCATAFTFLGKPGAELPRLQAHMPHTLTTERKHSIRT